ncbi:MAG TPA: PsbP-related protein [Terriglobales bacterium]|nr:PsbP-related protein [Terriglobales bacterium]
MKRLATMSLLYLAVCLATSRPVQAEEITLKDGTKIVGHMTGITSDKIEVETSYGKIQLNRNDILNINFPENSSAKAPGTAAVKQDLPKVDETLSGTQYVNRTGKFSLALPSEWMINADLRQSQSTLAGLSSKDKMRFAMVVQEEYPGSLESYKELTMLNARRTLGNFEELSELSTTIDGKTAMLIFYRGTASKSNNLPVEFLSAIITSGNSYTKITAWCVEPLFHDMQPAFEKIVNSYHSSGRLTAADSR